MNDKWTEIIAQNIATNGRWFCVLLFIACVAVFCKGYGERYIALAALSALPIGLTYMAEAFDVPYIRGFVSIASVFILAAVFINLLLV